MYIKLHINIYPKSMGIEKTFTVYLLLVYIITVIDVQGKSVPLQARGAQRVPGS